jgi:hypothetical protein
MTDSNNQQVPAAQENNETIRKPYQKPAFQHERVFETMALQCGKMPTTQGQCAMSLKNS